MRSSLEVVRRDCAYTPYAMEICKIFGNDSEVEVFTTVHYNGRLIIFKFVFDPANYHSIPSRIVMYHYTVPDDARNIFLDDDSWVEIIRSTIDSVLEYCTDHHADTMPDVVFEIYEDSGEMIRWREVHERGYQENVEPLLLTASGIHGSTMESWTTPKTDHSNVVHLSHNLGGRGDCELVCLKDTTNLTLPPFDLKTKDDRELAHSNDTVKGLFVFKGVGLYTYLQHTTETAPRIETFYHELRTVRSIPRHPNIISACSLTYLYVTAKKIDSDQQLVCGTLTPYMGKGTLDDQVSKGMNKKTHTTLVDKAKWCLQMSSAIAHTHHIAQSFHMDIKPSNMLLDDNKDLILIDWEQSGAPTCSLAPEADGTWDVKETEEGELVYEKYTGPPRQNLTYGSPKWNVFPMWRDECPKALEKAEVHSLGKTMWMLLQGVAELEEAFRDGNIYWTDNDTLEDWRDIVEQCLHPDPNMRIGLSELVELWEGVKERVGFFPSKVEDEICLIARPFL